MSVTSSIGMVSPLKKGVYYEFISIPCKGGERMEYSMPLGVLWGDHPMFKVYKETVLYKYLRNPKLGSLLLYSPNDPMDFFLSIKHDKIIEKKGPCLPSRPFALYMICKPHLKESFESYDLYFCTDIKTVYGKPEPYSRTYGCLVEMLVVLTKLKSKALDRRYLTYLDFLRWCIERSSPKEKRFKEVAEDVMQDAREIEKNP